jgi:hypothetical protein
MPLHKRHRLIPERGPGMVLGVLSRCPDIHRAKPPVIYCVDLIPPRSSRHSKSLRSVHRQAEDRVGEYYRRSR